MSEKSTEDENTVPESREATSSSDGSPISAGHDISKEERRDRSNSDLLFTCLGIGITVILGEVLYRLYLTELLDINRVSFFAIIATLVLGLFIVPYAYSKAYPI